jgi:hypothetical protein
MKMRMRLFGLSMLAVGAMVWAGCSGSGEDKSDTSTTQETSEMAPASALDGTPVVVAGVEFRPTAEWTNLGPSGMRQAEFMLPAVGEDTDSATMTVYYFGPEGGGSIESNLQRWVGQMSTPDGGSVAEAAERKEFESDGMKVHVVEVGGTYSSSMMGGAMSGHSSAHEGYRMCAAVVEGPQGNVFFKLTGPEATAGAMIAKFETMLRTLKQPSV